MANRMHFKWLMWLLVLPIGLFASCINYELESDEVLKPHPIGNKWFLGVYSKGFEAIFILYCNPKTSSILYEKYPPDAPFDRSKALQIIPQDFTTSKLKTLKLQYKRQGRIREIVVLDDQKRIDVVIKKHRMMLGLFTASAAKDPQPTLTKPVQVFNAKPLALDLGFKCTPQYFYETYGINALSVSPDALTNLDTKLRQWRLEKPNTTLAPNELALWLGRCQSINERIRHKHSHQIFAIQTQIADVFMRTWDHMLKLLSEYQQLAFNASYIPNEEHIEAFAQGLDALKNLEKQQANHTAFKDLAPVFLLPNSKALSNQIDYLVKQNPSIVQILQGDKFGSFYVDLKGASTKQAHFRVSGVVFYALRHKRLMVVQLLRSLDLGSTSTQYAIYKLSNSICGYFNNQIQTYQQASIKTTGQNFEVIDFCQDRAYANAYKALEPITPPVPRPSASVIPVKEFFEPVAPKAQIPQSKSSQIDPISPIAPPSASPKPSAKASCEQESFEGIDLQICKGVDRGNLSAYQAQGSLPNLEWLQENLDYEDFLYWAIYAKEGYFYFDEDAGWIKQNNADKDTVKLLLVMP